MSEPAIEIEGVSKRYQLGHIGMTSLRDEFDRWLRRRPSAPADEREFWALQDVSFKVQPGEVVGIVGRNGAGKSTLLKILSEITEPTRGEIRMRGRVASLLEVGTGFHPELSGRENIFLNGAILGMRKAEIRRKFDEIVAFSEVAQFIDTPIKRYSSGMYVRLAFAVAAHLEPEILIVDEVLAVGDQSFQQKCLNKMNEVAHGEGRTVLFVSHNMAAVGRLCDRVVLLDAGRLVATGPARQVVDRYLGENSAVRSRWVRPETPGVAAGKVVIAGACIRGPAGSERGVIAHGDPLTSELECRELATTTTWLLRVSIYDAQGNELLSSWDNEAGGGRTPRPNRTFRASCTFPGGLLRPGSYTIGFSACELAGDAPVALYDERDNALVFEVSPNGYMGRAQGGLVGPRARWNFQ